MVKRVVIHKKGCNKSFSVSFDLLNPLKSLCFEKEKKRTEFVEGVGREEETKRKMFVF